MLSTVRLRLVMVTCLVAITAPLKAAIRAQRDIVNEWPSFSQFEPNGPGTYVFGYEIDDPLTGNRQFRREERFISGIVKGSYGIVNSDGTITTTDYVSDKDGYRPSVSNRRSYDAHPNSASETRLRPSSNLNYKSQTQPAPVQLDTTRLANPPMNQNVLFAFPALHMSDNLPYRSSKPNNAFFEKNSKLSSLFFSDEYIDHFRGGNQHDDE